MPCATPERSPRPAEVLFTCGKDKLVLAWTMPNGEYMNTFEGRLASRVTFKRGGAQVSACERARVTSWL